MFSNHYIELVKKSGKDVYDFTFENAIKELVDTITKRYGIKRGDAKNLIINTLIYNVVQEEIISQCDYLLGSGDWKNDSDIDENSGDEDCIKL